MDIDERPVTRRDLDEALAKSEERMKASFVEALAKNSDELETRLLTAFDGYTERNELRMKRLESAEATTAARIASLEAEERFTALELRVLKLEQKLK